MNERGVHVVLGTGPLGLTVARHLAASGARVRAANRGGRADLPDSVEIVAANVADAADAKRACAGAPSCITAPTRPTRRGRSCIPP
jgi:uncharacterized protein YbjT (DUF2867 family)